MKKNTQKKAAYMWDLMIPLLLMICILPLLVHLAVYRCGYSQYDWYAADDLLPDFYCYYKSYFIDIVAAFALIILAFRMGLYKEDTKQIRWFYPLFVYVLFVMLSTIFSMNQTASVHGNFESFESVFVLIGYVVLAFYAYQMMEHEKDYQIILYGVMGISGVFGIVGLFQVFHCDLMQFAWVQKLLMSAEEYEMYGGMIEDTFSGNNVYLSLYNPNYAGIVLCMLFAVLFVMALTETQKKRKICYTVIAGLMMFLIWYTYSRASLLALIVVIVLAGAFLKPIRKKKKLWLLPLLLFAAGAFFIVIDVAGGSKYLSRMIDTNDREPLSSMTTEKNGIFLCYDGTDYRIWAENEQLYCRNLTTEDELYADMGEELSLPMEDDAKAVYIQEEQPEILLYLAETTLTFIRKDGTYYYKNFAGKISSMSDVKAADLHGLEYLGSARGYIWSRTIPLLKSHLLIGSGPDTFAELFPQEDYAGKIVYADSPDVVIEKAHNDYLTKWVQTGGISVLCILIFYVILLRMGKKKFYLADMDSMQMRLGLGCYLACISYMLANLFNDSTVQTSPLFWVFAGIVLSAAG